MCSCSYNWKVKAWNYCGSCIELRARKAKRKEQENMSYIKRLEATVVSMHKSIKNRDNDKTNN